MVDKAEKHLDSKGKAHQKYILADGTVVPGVTTILGIKAKPELIAWANKKGLEGIDTRKFVDEAATIGTLAHEMVQEDLGGPMWDRKAYSGHQIEIAENAYGKYLEWKKGKELATRLIEEQMVSERHRFGGTCDWYGLMDGKFWLLDIKTAKAICPEHLYQVAAYKTLLVEKGYKVDRAGILRIGRSEDEGFEFRSIAKAELSGGWKVFSAAHKFFTAVKVFEGRYGK